MLATGFLPVTGAGSLTDNGFSGAGVADDSGILTGGFSATGACVCLVIGCISDTTDLPPLFEIYARVREVIMKITAAHVVIFPKNEAAPVFPKSVWLPAPPNTAPILAPLPVCKSTIRIKAMETIICIVMIKAVMSLLCNIKLKMNNFTECIRLQTGSPHKSPINIRQRHQLFDIVRFNATSIQNPS